MNAHYDLIVIGAGPAGTSAAIAAARRGLRTLLVERYGFAGGMATAAMVNPWAGVCYIDPETGKAGELVCEMFGEIRSRLAARGGVQRFLFRPGGPVFYDAFDETQLRILLDEMLAEAGVQALFHAVLLDAELSAGRIAAVRVLTKSGVQRLTASHFIDSTGDADLAATAGVPFEIGRPGDGLCQPCSTMFRMGNVDKDGLLVDGLRAARQRVTELFAQAVQAGRIEFPFKAWVQFYDYPRPGAIHFNATRVFRLSALDAAELAAAEIEGRRQVQMISDWLKAEVPWFANAFVETVGPQIGVRETRRICGRYVLTGDDIRGGARFDDAVARSGYFIDIHDASTASDPHIATGGGIRSDFVPRRYYEIPFRCMQPVSGPTNLLVACRAIGTTHEAHAATRVMPTMHAIGQAAGAAAAVATRARVDLADVDGKAFSH